MSHFSAAILLSAKLHPVNMENESQQKVNRNLLFRWVGWFSLLNFFLPLILIIPKQIVLRTAGVCVAILGVMALLVDFEIYSQYRFHLNGMVFDFIIYGGGEIFDFSRATYTFVLLLVLAVALLEILFSSFAWKFSQKNLRFKIRNKLIFVVLALLIASNLIHAWADASYYRPITTMTRNLPLLRQATAKRFMEKHGFVNLDENWKLNKLSGQKVKNTSINYPLAKLEFESGSEPLNIVFIVIDSWRFDMLDENVTPNINLFMQQLPVLEFEHHTSGGNGTRTGIFSMFYGIFGSYWLMMENEQKGPVLIRELLNKNYQMGIFASSKLTSPAFNQTVFSDVENLRLRSDGDNAWERDLDSDYDPLPFINRYKTSLHFIDSLVGKVLSRLAKEKLLERTMIVITGDHAQEFNENGKFSGGTVQISLNTKSVCRWSFTGLEKMKHPLLI